ncbi:3-ketodihydrosphingosine reductase-like [Centruroides sculpturatus]|uniref:3-ketodihydrosphingosine reductase-like n=1 Tax=Centruroides sculpturatus TaxID=218467 RepID=UPI000C6E0F09|nr:3-ketodihydrosphingosine reductase-like [Centruroides sculpturatus]
MWYLVLGVFILFFILVNLLFDVYMRSSTDISSFHVLVTGGSSGIGKSLAIEAISRGANVTLIARNKARLEEAKEEVESYAVDKQKQKVKIFSIDISKYYENVEVVFQKAEEQLGPIDILFNCAGTAFAQKFEDICIEDFKRMIDVNYIGSVQATKAVLPCMKKRRKGIIVFVSSIAGLFGIYGFSAYSASKFALKGLAECLQMEVKPYSISITVAYPPDTETPGFIEEQKTKPIETKQISQTAAVLSPEIVAKCIFNDSLDGRFSSTIGIEGWMISNLCCGMSPISSLSQMFIQILLMGPFRLIGVFCLKNFDKIIKDCLRQQEENKKVN